jgi:hypothetical protein
LRSRSLARICQLLVLHLLVVGVVEAAAQAAEMVSDRVAALAAESINAMGMTQMKKVAVVLVLLGRADALEVRGEL